MRKLLSYLKSLPSHPNKFSIPSSSLKPHRSKNFASVATESNLKELFKASFDQPHSVSQSQLLWFNTLRSWRSRTSFSHNAYGFFEKPMLVKQIIENTHVPIRLLRARFLRHHYRNDHPFRIFRRYWTSRQPTSNDVVLMLIAANVAVFLLWRIADPKFMQENFMISMKNITSGRLHTMVTSAFSHIDAGHLIYNMIGLYFFGSNIANIFGPGFLLKLYLAGALGGSIFFLLHNAYLTISSKAKRLMYDPSSVPGLGASGAINAIMLLDIFLFPKATLYLEFFIPIPAALLGAFLIGKDILMIIQGDTHVSGAAHLGGAVVAALVWARLKKGWI